MSSFTNVKYLYINYLYGLVNEVNLKNRNSLKNPPILDKIKKWESLFVYSNVLVYSSSKLGVNTPFPILLNISSLDQKRPPASSVADGVIGPS